MKVRSGGAVRETREHIDCVRDVGSRVLEPLEHAAARTVLGVVVRGTGVLGSDKTEGKCSGNRNIRVETEAGKGRTGVRRLMEENIAAAWRAGDLERKVGGKRAAIVHLETAGKFSSKRKTGRRGSSGKEKVIDPDGNGDEIRRTDGATSVKARVMLGLGEAE